MAADTLGRPKNRARTADRHAATRSHRARDSKTLNHITQNPPLPGRDTTGKLYFDPAKKTFETVSGGNSDQMGNQRIVGAVRLHGTPDLKIAYDGRNSVEAYRSILVR